MEQRGFEPLHLSDDFGVTARSDLQFRHCSTNSEPPERGSHANGVGFEPTYHGLTARC